MRVAVGDGGKVFGQFKSWWVPSAGRLQPDDGTWIAVRPKVRRALDRLTRGLETFPGRRLPGFENAGAEGVTPPPARADTPAPARSASSSSGDVPVLPLAAALIVSDWPRSWPRRGCQDEGRSPAALSLYGAAGSRRLPGRTI